MLNCYFGLIIFSDQEIYSFGLLYPWDYLFFSCPIGEVDVGKYAFMWFHNFLIPVHTHVIPSLLCLFFFVKFQYYFTLISGSLLWHFSQKCNSFFNKHVSPDPQEAGVLSTDVVCYLQACIFWYVTLVSPFKLCPKFNPCLSFKDIFSGFFPHKVFDNFLAIWNVVIIICPTLSATEFDNIKVYLNPYPCIKSHG